ncbi:MAG: Soluble lytic murein transglycosylase and related regulatory protein [Acidobacteria bacterium]|nr:Soluble lytic murein transglycosylase and related regulatory protein [Acidobacteriota bacterium]
MLKGIGKRRWLLIIIGIAIVIGASLPPFMSASCFTRQQTSSELRALENLRAMTRNGVLPAEDAVARIESDYPRTKAAGLARLLRARMKTSNKDFVGAAALLDAAVIRDHTALGDYALLLRGDALEQAGKRSEAQSAFEKLSNDYPSSFRARDAVLRAANLLLQNGGAAAMPSSLRDLAARNDAAALLLTAKAAEQQADNSKAVAAYRRIYFYAPAAAESSVAAPAIARLGGNLTAGNPEEAMARADHLFEAKKYVDAFEAYGQAFAAFPNTANGPTQLRRGIAASYLRKTAEAATALNSVPTSAGETRAEALYNLTQTYARARQWPQVHTTIEEMRRAFPKSSWTPRAITNAGQIADEAKVSSEAVNLYRTAVNAFPGSAEVAQAQFNLAWAAHDAKNFQESARQLTEHLAYYADKNTDNRGRAGYWAARDSETSGKVAEARALYAAMQGRYDANWYGYLAKQRLDAMTRGGNTAPQSFAADSLIGRATANLQTVTVAEETAGAEADAAITRADQLSNIGLDDWALEEMARASEAAPFSPRINLATARIYRNQEDNVRALNILKKSYPDYSQMKPEELTRDEWDVFYPLAYWDIISQESRVRNLDPFQVAGLIRQETVFNPRSRSGAAAYGLMQVLVPTGRLTAKKYGVERAITADALYEPRLNIQLGTAYLRDQVDKFGRIEYVAAAYNAGPMRVPQWRASLPAEMDEWAEAVPFKETRLYIQGVVRNRLQYERLYDKNGKFRPEVGSRPVNPPPQPEPNATPTTEPANPTVRKRRVMSDDEE